MKKDTNENYIKFTRNFKLFCVEHAISMDKLTKYDNFLSDNIKFEKNLKELNIMINDIKTEIKKLKYFDIEVEDKSSNLYFYRCTFSHYITGIITKITNFLNKNKKSEYYEKYINIIYHEGYERSFYPKIEIESDNFNRIHIGVTLLLLRNIGIGKKIYQTMIKELNYISSESYTDDDRTIDAELVWKSIVTKESNIYSFICKNKIISFSDKYDKEMILSKLKDFFKNELINTKNEIIIDNDFEQKYNINKL